MRKIFIITATLAFIAAAAFARNKLEASIEMERVYIGNPVYLYLTFTGSSSVPQPEVPEPDGLRIRSVGSSTEMSVVRGVVSQSITYTYLVIPAKEGSYDIGPFSVVHDGAAYHAGTVRLTVDQTPPSGAVSGTTAPRPSPAPARPATPPAPAPPSTFAPSARAESAPYSGRDVFLVMEAAKRTLYVNEAVPVTIKLYVEGVGLKDIEYPVYSHEGFSAGEFLKPERKRESYRGSIYDTLEFRQELFAIKEGEHILGPARLNCKMISRARTPSRRSSIFGVSVFMDDPFSTGFETYPIVLETEAIPVTILPFPDKGRPSDFKGAVGDFSFEAEVKPVDVKVGDPITLVMTVGGYGNMDTVTAPALADSAEFKVYEPEVSKKGNKKIYEQILIPRNEGVKEVPQVKFSYFNPVKQKYETVTRGPFSVKVAEAPHDQAIRMVAMPMGEHVFFPKEELGRDILHIKDSMGAIRGKDRIIALDSRFWALQFLPPAVFLMFYMSYRKRKRIKTDKGYARLLKAPRKARSGISRARAFLDRNDTARFYDTVHKTLEEYLGNRFNLPRGSVTVNDIDLRLREAGCEEHILQKLRDVFAKCEMARYASSVSEDLSHSLVLHDVRTIIDHVEKMKV